MQCIQFERLRTWLALTRYGYVGFESMKTGVKWEGPLNLAGYTSDESYIFCSLGRGFYTASTNRKMWSVRDHLSVTFKNVCEE